MSMPQAGEEESIRGLQDQGEAELKRWWAAETLT